jgi:PAS domain S-box-containing protein
MTIVHRRSKNQPKPAGKKSPTGGSRSRPIESGENRADGDLKYQALFRNMLNGYACCRMIRGWLKPIDFVYLEVNSQFEALTGLKNVVGKKVSDVIPGIRESNPELFEIYGRVAAGGGPERFETYLPALDIWFSISAYCPAKRTFAAVFENITERKRDEEKIARLVERYNLAADSAGLGIWDWDIRKNILTWDDRMVALYGVRKENFGGAYEAWLNGLHPEDREEQDRISAEARAGEREYDTEFRVIWPDGSVRRLRAHAVVIRDDAGRPLRMTGVNFDVTEIRRQEKALRESEDKFRYLFDYSTLGKSLTEPSGTVHVNRAFGEMMGYSENELKDKKWQDISHPDDIPLTQVEVEAVLSDRKKSSRFIKRYIRKDGSIIWADVTTSLRRDENGNPMYFMTTISDITDRKRIEESLRTLNIMNEAILAAVPDIIMQVDNNRVYSWANRAGIDFFGEDVIGREAAHYFVGEQGTYESVRPLFEGSGDTFYVESWQRRRDGEKRLLAWWCRALKDDRGNVTSAISSAHDITDSYGNEKKLTDQLDELGRWNAVMVEREMKIIDLKREVNALLEAGGSAPRYPAAEPENAPDEDGIP